jgi:hypothetical protein
MKVIIFIILHILASFVVNAQGLERFNAYDFLVIVDNLPQNIFSKEIQNYYYKTISQKQYQDIYQLIDLKAKQRRLNYTSRYARSGYLFINQTIAEEVANVRDTLSVQYNYNGNFIDTAAEVHQLIKLRSRQIASYKIDVDLSQGIISASIYDKKYQRKM